jgi:hypothetical protein
MREGVIRLKMYVSLHVSGEIWWNDIDGTKLLVNPAVI